MSSIDHLALSVSDYEQAIRFYEKALAPLGISKLLAFDNDGGKISGFGATQPFFWVGDGGKQGGRLHVAFGADDRAAIDAFHAAALAAGATDNGAPGIRVNYHPNYYAAFVLDLDGNNIEAVCHR